MILELGAGLSPMRRPRMQHLGRGSGEFKFMTDILQFAEGVPDLDPVRKPSHEDERSRTDGSRRLRTPSNEPSKHEFHCAVRILSRSCVNRTKASAASVIARADIVKACTGTPGLSVASWTTVRLPLRISSSHRQAGRRAKPRPVRTEASSTAMSLVTILASPCLLGRKSKFIGAPGPAYASTSRSAMRSTLGDGPRRLTSSGTATVTVGMCVSTRATTSVLSGRLSRTDRTTSACCRMSGSKSPLLVVNHTRI